MGCCTSSQPVANGAPKIPNSSATVPSDSGAQPLYIRVRGHILIVCTAPRRRSLYYVNRSGQKSFLNAMQKETVFHGPLSPSQQYRDWSDAAERQRADEAELPKTQRGGRSKEGSSLAGLPRGRVGRCRTAMAKPDRVEEGEQDFVHCRQHLFCTQCNEKCASMRAKFCDECGQKLIRVQQ